MGSVVRTEVENRPGEVSRIPSCCEKGSGGSSHSSGWELLLLLAAGVSVLEEQQMLWCCHNLIVMHVEVNGDPAGEEKLSKEVRPWSRRTARGIDV